MDDHSLSAQIARDLYYIHENRIDAYRELLYEAAEMDLDLQAILERMIEQCRKDREQLQKMMSPNTTAPGEIYKSWQVMLNPVTDRDKKSVLATLADDELIMMNTYSLALSLVTGPEFVKMLESQQQELKKLHAHIREYQNAP